MPEWINPRHTQTMARFRQAQAAVRPSVCEPCAGSGTRRGAPCGPCAGTGEQRPVRAFTTT